MALLLAAGALAPAAQARVLLKQDEALKLAFPGAPPQRRTAYLSEEQRRAAERLGGARVESRIWTYYVGASSAGVRSYAYFDTHTVRTMPETFMAVIDDSGRLRFLELLAFHEPDDYLPPGRWLRQLDGRSLDPQLYVRRAIRNITGASLTSQALTEGARRVLAVHHVLHAAPARRSP